MNSKNAPLKLCGEFFKRLLHPVGPKLVEQKEIWLYFSQTLYIHNNRTRYYLFWLVTWEQLAPVAHTVEIISTEKEMLV